SRFCLIAILIAIDSKGARPRRGDRELPDRRSNLSFTAPRQAPLAPSPPAAGSTWLWPLPPSAHRDASLHSNDLSVRAANSLPCRRLGSRSGSRDRASSQDYI